MSRFQSKTKFSVSCYQRAQQNPLHRKIPYLSGFLDQVILILESLGQITDSFRRKNISFRFAISIIVRQYRFLSRCVFSKYDGRIFLEQTFFRCNLMSKHFMEKAGRLFFGFFVRKLSDQVDSMVEEKFSFGGGEASLYSLWGFYRN